MTITDASNELYKWFSENDSFKLSTKENIQDDFKKLFLVSEDTELAKGVFESALSEYESQKIVKKIELADSQVWVLNKSFSEFSQTVSIQPNTAKAISDLINKCYQNDLNNKKICKSSEISEADIQEVILIAYRFANKTEDS